MVSVLNDSGAFLSVIIKLNNIVTIGTIARYAALKCSDASPYSSKDFPLFNSSIAVPTSTSEIQTPGGVLSFFLHT